ncbi:hypothetical protein ABKN59_008158 [Abortiporus biennis]
MMCKQLDTIRAHAIVNAAPLTIRSLTEVFLHRMASIVTSSQGEGFSDAFNYCCSPDLIVRDDDIGETIMYPQHVQDNITVYCGNTKTITSLIGEQKKYLDLILPEYDLHAFYLACRPEIMFVARRPRKKVIRGVLTNGRVWQFMILRLNTSEAISDSSMSSGQEFVDGTYYDYVCIVNRRDKVDSYEANLVAGILGYWVRHTHDDFNSSEEGNDGEWHDVIPLTPPSESRE